jgi:hypothetical protein
MLSGFNTNVRHRGVLFHVQTEDSGRAHPHVITHLYFGGTILASDKSGYAEQLERDDLASRVRTLMESQHAAMLERLGKGELDDLIGDRLGPEVFSTTKHGSSSGHTQRTAGPRPAPPRPIRAGSAAAADRPLDELILDFLVESTRRARRQRAEGADAQRKRE